jgi:hypothetical protein
MLQSPASGLPCLLPVAGTSGAGARCGEAHSASSAGGDVPWWSAVRVGWRSRSAVLERAGPQARGRIDGEA